MIRVEFYVTDDPHKCVGAIEKQTAVPVAGELVELLGGRYEVVRRKWTYADDAEKVTVYVLLRRSSK